MEYKGMEENFTPNLNAVYVMNMAFGNYVEDVNSLFLLPSLVLSSMNSPVPLLVLPSMNSPVPLLVLHSPEFPVSPECHVIYILRYLKYS